MFQPIYLKNIFLVQHQEKKLLLPALQKKEPKNQATFKATKSAGWLCINYSWRIHSCEVLHCLKCQTSWYFIMKCNKPLSEKFLFILSLFQAPEKMIVVNETPSLFGMPDLLPLWNLICSCFPWCTFRLLIFWLISQICINLEWLCQGLLFSVKLLPSGQKLFYSLFIKIKWH